MTMRMSKNRIDMDDKILRKPVLQDYGETVVGGVDGTNTGSSYTIDLTEGNVFHLVLTANCTFTFSNPAASGTATTFTLYLRQDGVGSRTATWPSAVVWPGDTAPTLTTTATRTDVFTFTTTDAGTTWFGSTGAQNFDASTQAWQFITSIDLSNDATADFTQFDANVYDAYMFKLHNVIPATDAAAIRMYTSSDGGSTYDSSAGDYQYAWWGVDAAASVQGADTASVTKIDISGGCGSGTNEAGACGTVYLFGPHLTAYTQVFVKCVYIDDGGNPSLLQYGSYRTANEDVDAVRILASTGNLESGTITMFGLKNS